MAQIQTPIVVVGVNPLTDTAYPYVNALSGPYDSIDAALKKVPKNYRSIGLVIGILKDNVVTEYVFKGGLEDIHLVLKDNGGENVSKTIEEFNETIKSNEREITEIKNKLAEEQSARLLANSGIDRKLNQQTIKIDNFTEKMREELVRLTGLSIDAVFATKAQMTATTSPVHDKTKEALRVGDLVFVNADDNVSNNGVYRYNNPDYTYLGGFGNAGVFYITKEQYLKGIIGANASISFPTGGLDQTNKYTLASAIDVVNNSDIYNIIQGFILVFIDLDGNTVTYQFNKGDVELVENWVKIDFANLAKLDYNSGLSHNDFTNEYKEKLDKIITDGDGKKCLLDDGTYGKINSAGGGFYNVDNKYPKSEGYYTINSAIEVLRQDTDIEEADLKGMIITFETGDGQWIDYRFIGTDKSDIGNVSKWVEQTVRNVVKEVIINGERKAPDASGRVTIEIDTQTADSNLSVDSDNPIANKVVASEIAELKRKTISSIEVEQKDESTSVLKVYNESQELITSADVPLGQGGGTGQSSATRINVKSSLSVPTAKEGDKVILTYSYDQINILDNVSTGNKAEIEISIVNGVQEVYKKTFSEITAGEYNLDISEHVKRGTLTVRVKASVETLTDSGEKSVQVRQAVSQLKVAYLSLKSAYNISDKIDGYKDNELVIIPYTITGEGNKTISLYLNGEQIDNSVISRSGTSNSTFSLNANRLLAGRNSIQLVAVAEFNGVSISSESIYFNVYKYLDNIVNNIALKFNRADGKIFDNSNHLTPTITVPQFETVEFEFSVFNPKSPVGEVEITKDNLVENKIAVTKAVNIYTNRYINAGVMQYKFNSVGINYSFYIDVADSKMDIEEVKDNLRYKLSAYGRNNKENNPAIWEYNSTKTVFEGVDWSSSGWNNGALHLINGAKAIIQNSLFNPDMSLRGGTFEIEFKTSNTIDSEKEVISCNYNGAGLFVTPNTIKLVSSEGQTVVTPFASNKQYKISFVIEAKNQNRLVHIYVNGKHSGSVAYNNTDSFYTPANILLTFNSEYANLDIYSIRVYDRNLSSDEILSNYIIDRQSAQEVVSLFEENDVLEHDEVSIEKLRQKGKSVMLIKGNVKDIDIKNNKKAEVAVDIYYYSAFGKEFDFVCKQAGLRIQGTSSTAYPVKNYRIYLDRPNNPGFEFTVNGVAQKKNQYAFRKGAIPVKLFTIKADFAESSSTHNTGFAVLINDVYKRLGALTPPQEYQRKQAGIDNVNVRIGIDGFPMDLFIDNDNNGNVIYGGKYNFNNDKSKAGEVFGFEKIKGFNDSETLAGQENPCICLEFLNNSHNIGKFLSADLSTLEEGSGEKAVHTFDRALEFRYPEDQTWQTTTDNKRNAIQRLWSWVISCQNDTDKFKREYQNYFNKESLLLWYLITEYFLMVDQRAKNMMLVSWDYKTWYFIPYDNDTALGLRNDGALVYPFFVEDYKTEEQSEYNYDYSVKNWIYAGHDSLLWKLVYKTLQNELRETAEKLRSENALSTKFVKKILNNDQMDNWSARIYNRDAHYKYIRPLIDGVVTASGAGTKYNYLYALQGSREAHRDYIIDNRFAFIDASYGVGDFKSDRFTFYLSNAFKENNDPRVIKVTAAEKFYFGYGFSSGSKFTHGLFANKGQTLTFRYDQNLSISDPQIICGASRLKELDFTDVAQFLVSNNTFTNCKIVEKINLASKVRNNEKVTFNFSSCESLKELDLTNQYGVNSLDLSNSLRLKKLEATKTNLLAVSIPAGCLIEIFNVPTTIETLILKDLPNLTNDGIANGNILTGVTKLVIDNCPKINFEKLVKKCPNLKNIRITGLNLTGNTSELSIYKNYKGVSADGSNVDYPALSGDYQLSVYFEDNEFNEFRNSFPELNVKQSEYSTVIDFIHENGELVITPNKLFNPENNTGYTTLKDYVYSGHFKKIIDNRHRYLGKQIEQGVMKIIQLHDENSGKFNDNVNVDFATDAFLDGTQGDVYVREPHYWYKGVSDFVNGKLYIFMSSNKEKPKQAAGKKLTIKDLIDAGNVQYNKYFPKGLKINNIKDNPEMILIKVDVEGYKKLNCPVAPITTYTHRGDRIVSDNYCTFVDADGNVIKQHDDVINKWNTAGVNWIFDIPTNAKYFYASIPKSNFMESGEIWLTRSLNPVDWVDDWVEHKESLCSVVFGNRKNNKFICSLINYKFDEIEYSLIKTICEKQNIKTMSYEEHKNIAWLHIIKKGTFAVSHNVQTYNSFGKFIQYYGNNHYAIEGIKLVNNLVKYGMQETNVKHDNLINAIKSINNVGEQKIEQIPYNTLSLGYISLHNGLPICDIEYTWTANKNFYSSNKGNRSIVAEHMFFSDNSIKYNIVGGKYLDIFRNGFIEKNFGNANMSYVSQGSVVGNSYPNNNPIALGVDYSGISGIFSETPQLGNIFNSNRMYKFFYNDKIEEVFNVETYKLYKHFYDED